MEHHTLPKNKSGPMAVFKQTSPMPLLMSVVVKNGDKLGFTEEQSAVLTQWRVEHMATSLKVVGNDILAQEKAINKAALDGKPKAEIEKMLESVLEKRKSLAGNMLKCQDLMMKPLDASQWKKPVSIYSNKQ